MKKVVDAGRGGMLPGDWILTWMEDWDWTDVIRGIEKGAVATVAGVVLKEGLGSGNWEN